MAKSRKNKPSEAPEHIIPIIDGAFELVNIKPIKINTGLGNFDLNNLSTEQAELLIAKGCSFIRKKQD